MNIHSFASMVAWSIKVNELNFQVETDFEKLCGNKKDDIKPRVNSLNQRGSISSSCHGAPQPTVPVKSAESDKVENDKKISVTSLTRYVSTLEDSDLTQHAIEEMVFDADLSSKGYVDLDDLVFVLETVGRCEVMKQEAHHGQQVLIEKKVQRQLDTDENDQMGLYRIPSPQRPIGSSEYQIEDSLFCLMCIIDSYIFP